MKFDLKNLAAIFLVIIAVGFFIAQKNQPETITVSLGISEYKLEVAKTNLERQQGLSGREKLQEYAGMLFVFEKPGKYPFWMKDMRFPIDIIWVNENKTIVEINKNIQPETYPKTFGPPSPIQYVIEINALASNKSKIEVGQTLDF